MTELTSMRKLRWERRKKAIQEAAVKKSRQVSEWMRENKETLAIAIPAGAVVLKGAMRTVKGISRDRAVKNDIRDRQTRFYDHQLGCYWHTRRPLTTDEQLSVKRRKAAGESYGDIFQSMKLLK